LPRETLSKIPTPASETTIADPPELIKGNATPVKGTKPVITATLTRAWKASQHVMPQANNAEKASLACRAILKPR
jgi:hypothetical protein